MHYSFALELNDHNDSIKGEAGIKFVRRHQMPSVSFDLTGIVKNGKGMKVVKASIQYQSEMKLLFRQENDKLIIELPTSEQNDTVTMIIQLKSE